MPNVCGDAPLLLALGVLSRPAALFRRSLVRRSWGTSPLIGDSVCLRFVIGTDDDQAVRASIAAEQWEHRDIHITSVSERRWYAAKAFAWLRAATHSSVSPSFVAIADDDAFVVIRPVVDDLAAIVASGCQRAVYAAFEWFSYHRNTGRAGSWGATLGAVGGTTFAWRGQTRVTSAMWPGARVSESQQCARHCIRRGGESRCYKRCWPRCMVGRRDQTLLALRSRNARRSDQSRPFPLAKGTFVAWSPSVAVDLADSNHSLQEQAHAARTIEKRGASILHDVFMSYLLASSRGSLGMANLTLVDIGILGREDRPQQGFTEFAGDLNRTGRAYPEGLRVIHMGRRPIRQYSRRRWAGQAVPHDSEDQILSEGFALLQSKFHSSVESHSTGDAASAKSSGTVLIHQQPATSPLSQAHLICNSPSWFDESQCVITAGEDWVVCVLARNTASKVITPSKKRLDMRLKSSSALVDVLHSDRCAIRNA